MQTECVDLLLHRIKSRQEVKVAAEPHREMRLHTAATTDIERVRKSPEYYCLRIVKSLRCVNEKATEYGKACTRSASSRTLGRDPRRMMEQCCSTTSGASTGCKIQMRVEERQRAWNDLQSATTLLSLAEFNTCLSMSWAPVREAIWAISYNLMCSEYNREKAIQKEEKNLSIEPLNGHNTIQRTQIQHK